MEGFATGFKNSAGPGFLLENEKYKIQFKGVMCDDTKNIVSHGFEYCYNWREVMELVLAATEKAGNDNTAEIEEAAEDALKEWMTTFQGWGLLSSIVPAGSVRHIVLSLAYTSQNWDEETGGEYSEEKVFDAVKHVYDNMEGKEINNLLPKLGIWFEEIVSGGEDDERKKNFTLFFNAKWVLEVKFVVEKKRVNRNLLELAAETAVRGIYSEDEIENLEVPFTLLSAVREKFRDAEWVRNHWRLKAELEASEDEDNDDNIHSRMVWPLNSSASDHYDHESDGEGDHSVVEEGFDTDEVLSEDISSDHDASDKEKEAVAARNIIKYGEEGPSFIWLIISIVFLVGALIGF